MTRLNSDPKPDDGHPMYGIRFMMAKGMEPGYLVKIGRRKVDHTKWFGIVQFGSDALALRAAQAWRDEQICSLPVLTKQEFVSMIRTNNTSGAAGVVRITKRSRKRSGAEVSAHYWLARPPRCVKASQRSFSIAKYGEERAWELAAKARREMEQLAVGNHVPNVPECFVEKARKALFNEAGYGSRSNSETSFRAKQSGDSRPPLG